MTNMEYSFEETPKDETPPLEIAKEEGERTKITENVLRIAREIDANNQLNGLDLVEEVCTYVRTMVPGKTTLELFKKQNPKAVFDKRTRSADDLLSPDNLIPGHSRVRNIDGCTEFAHITRALLLAKGIPCVITDTLQEEWLRDKSKGWTLEGDNNNPVSGHNFVDVYIAEKGKWYTINPGNRDERVHEYGDYSIGDKRYVNPIRGKDSADIGFPTMKEYLKALETALKTF